MSQAITRQALRTRPAPASVSWLLALVNGIPGSCKGNEDFLTAYTCAEDSKPYDFAKGLYLAVKAAVADWGSEARNYVLGSGPDAAEPMLRFREVVAIRDLVRAIADQNNKFWRGGLKSKLGFPEYRDFEIPQGAVRAVLIRLTLKTEPDRPKHRKHKIRSSTSKPKPPKPKRADLLPTGLLSELLQHVVELDRLKSCAYSKCGKIFWAGRVDKPCCSDPCLNAVRQHTWRHTPHTK